MKFVYADGGRSKYFTATNVGDCAVRAIANATGKDYKVVYDRMKELNKGKSCRNGTPKNVDKKYLKELGWEWHPTMTIGSGCRTHLTEEDLPSGTLVVQVSKHLTCVKDGVIYDTYDCSRDRERCVYGYWTPPKRWKYEKGQIIHYKTHECVITSTWEDDGKKGVSIIPTGNYGFEVDLYEEQLEKYLG